MSDNRYSIGVGIVGIPTFLSCWIYAVAQYGWVLGLGLGWLPAAFIGAIAGLIWPLFAVLIVLGFFALNFAMRRDPPTYLVAVDAIVFGPLVVWGIVDQLREWLTLNNQKTVSEASDEYEYELMPGPDARRTIQREYLAGILRYLGGICAGLLSLGWIIAHVIGSSATQNWAWWLIVGSLGPFVLGIVTGYWLYGPRIAPRPPLDLSQEMMPAPDVRRLLQRTYVAGVALYVAGSGAVLLSMGWAGAMLTDGQAYRAWWTPLINVAALVFLGGLAGRWLRAITKRRNGTRG